MTDAGTLILRIKDASGRDVLLPAHVQVLDTISVTGSSSWGSSHESDVDSFPSPQKMIKEKEKYLEVLQESRYVKNLESVSIDLTYAFAELFITG